MLTNQFDVNAPSALSLDRINHLNRLARQAFNNSGRTESGHNDLGACLQVECFAMEEILREITEFDTYVEFYSHINAAFDMLIEKDKSAFRTYKMLTTMFRVFARHEAIAEGKWKEVRQVLSDIDVLEGEAIERRKGDNTDEK